MNTNKSIFLSQHYLAMRVADIFNTQVKSALIAMKSNKTFFPTPATFYDKEIVKERQKQLESEKLEITSSKTLKFNSSNAVYDSKSIYDSKNFVPTFAQNNQHLQSKNAKNHYYSNNYLNQISPLINPISVQANPIFNNNLFNSYNNKNHKFKNGLFNDCSNSFNLGNNPINNFGSLCCNGYSNCFSRESTMNNYNCNNFINSNNTNNCQINQSNLVKNSNDNLKDSNTINVNKENSLLNKSFQNDYINNITNNHIYNSSKQNNLFNNINGVYINSQLSENNFSLNSFIHKNSSTIEKSESLIVTDNSYFENNPNENSFISNFNSSNCITRKSSNKDDNLNFNSNNSIKNKDVKSSKNLFENFEFPIKSIFLTRKNSRFFDNENKETNNSLKTESLNTTSNSVDVPDFISEFISKKFSKFSFFKKYAKDDEEVDYNNFLLKELDEDHEWAKFIFSFKSFNLEEYSMLNKFNSA